MIPHSSEQAYDSWFEEKQSAFLYRVLAEVEAGNRKAKLFEGLAKAAEGQADLWRPRITGADIVFRPELRARIVAWFLHRWGARPLLHVLAALKVRGISVYTHPFHGHGMPTQAPLPDHNPESFHRAVASGTNLRAAVFGVNDGLVSNASLILGVAGATAAHGVGAYGAGSANADWILLSGGAGLLAGAFSMAAGEFISMQSQTEFFEHQIALEREELKTYPEEEARELALIYEAKGIRAEDAKSIAEQIVANPEHALDALAREELGLNPSELGSPWKAAAYSFAAFAFGAFIPLLPFLLFAPGTALGAAIAFSLTALFAIGAAISLFTGGSALKGALRMLIVGVSAGGLTYFIGHLFGTGVA